MYYSELNKPPITPTPSGKKIIDKYELKIIDDKKVLKKSGKRDIYEVKQENLEQTKIYNILKRHAQGDETALNQRKGIFIDVTQLPTSLLDAENALIKAQRSFEELPLETRTKYNQNWREWLRNIENQVKAQQQVEQKKSYINTITPTTNQGITQSAPAPTTTNQGITQSAPAPTRGEE